MADEVIKDGVGFGSEPNYLRSAQQTFVRAVEREGIKEDAIVVGHCQRLPKFHDTFTSQMRVRGIVLLGWVERN